MKKFQTALIVGFFSTLNVYAQPSSDTVRFTVEKYCESIYGIVDAAQKPPRPKKTWKYNTIKIKPTGITDTEAEYHRNIKGLQLDITFRTGQVKLTQPISYYTGHDSRKLPEYANGVTQLEITINKRKIPLSFDHILNAKPQDLVVMKDLTSPKLFILLTNGEGASTDKSLWIIYNNKVMGHYEWEYGYDEWSPRNGIDTFVMKPPLDECDVYKITGLR